MFEVSTHKSPSTKELTPSVCVEGSVAETIGPVAFESGYTVEYPCHPLAPACTSISTSSTTELYHNSPSAVKLAGASSFAVASKGIQFDATRSFVASPVGAV